MVARVLASLRSLSELDLFSKPRLWDLLSLSLGLISHPNVWIRQGWLPFSCRLTVCLSELNFFLLSSCLQPPPESLPRRLVASHDRTPGASSTQTFLLCFDRPLVPSRKRRCSVPSFLLFVLPPILILFFTSSKLTLRFLLHSIIVAS